MRTSHPNDLNQESCDGHVQLSLRRVEEIATPLRGRSLDWLGPQELERWSTIKTLARQSQFLAGHWLARFVIADWLGGNWSDYLLSAPEDASPVWLNGPMTVVWQDVFVSLSHSGDWVACALARHPVGVDVECSDRMRDFPALGSWIYPEFELQAFAQLPTEQQRRVFYTQWVLKEAWLKQAGKAPVRKTMQSIGFTPGPGVRQAIVAQTLELALALYPAHLANTQMIDPLLRAMHWSDWTFSGSIG